MKIPIAVTIPFPILKATNPAVKATKDDFKVSIAPLLSLTFFKKSAIFFATSDSLPANIAILFATFFTLVAFFVVSVFTPRNDSITSAIIETKEPNILFMLSQASKNAKVVPLSCIF